MDKDVAIIFLEGDGLYRISGTGLGFLDARGRAYPTKAAAIRAAADMGYTHVTGSGSYWPGVRRIPEKYKGV